jgi:long-chain acyl-CoA synthetase
MFVSGDFETVCKDERIVKLISDDLRKVAVEVKLTKQEIPSKIYVESLQWLPESGLVTDAFKLKRKVHFQVIYRDINKSSSL